MNLDSDSVVVAVETSAFAAVIEESSQQQQQQQRKLALNLQRVFINDNLVISEPSVQAGSAPTGGQNGSQAAAGESQTQVKGAALLGKPCGRSSEERLASPETRSRGENKPASKGREAAVCRVSPFVAAEMKASKLLLLTAGGGGVLTAKPEPELSPFEVDRPLVPLGLM